MPQRPYALSDRSLWIPMKTDGGATTQVTCGSRYSFLYFFSQLKRQTTLLNFELWCTPLRCKSGIKYDHGLNVFYWVIRHSASKLVASSRLFTLPIIPLSLKSSSQDKGSARSQILADKPSRSAHFHSSYNTPLPAHKHHLYNSGS